MLPEPEPAARQASARLVERIRAEIRAAGGWIPFARYMELALHAPGLGYYAGGAAKLGAPGDFATAPEMGPLYARTLARLARADVLILDDFALAPLDSHQRQDLLEVLEDRTGTRSTIVTSQLPVAKWHAYVDDPTLADAICDRLLHNAHRVVLKGPSRRKPEAPE